MALNAYQTQNKASIGIELTIDKALDFSRETEAMYKDVLYKGDIFKFITARTRTRTPPLPHSSWR